MPQVAVKTHERSKTQELPVDKAGQVARFVSMHDPSILCMVMARKSWGDRRMGQDSKLIKCVI